MRSTVLLASLLLACGSDTVTTDGGAVGSSSGSNTALDSSTTTHASTSTTTSGADETSQTSVAFVDNPDLGQGEECSIYAQDCPAGFKCMPYANDGGSSWNATGCFPVADDPSGPGEPCMAENGGTSGIDTCQLGSMCFYVDPETSEGTCFGFCMEDQDGLYCEDPSTYCHIFSDGSPVLCLPRCHPLEDDCPEGRGCYPAGDDFQCRGHAQDAGNAGDPCGFDGHCAPPTYCIPQDYVPGCTDSFNCCTSFCTIGDDAVCLPGQTCQPWYVPGDAPPGYEDLGACVLP